VLSGVAGRYASALFELAQDERRAAEVEHDLVKCETLMGASEDLVRLVRSPVIAADDQSRAIAAVLQKAEAQPLTVNFFKLLAKNRRLFAAADVARAYRAIAAKARGEVSAEVASATPLSGAQRAELEATLKASMGKDVSLSTKVDPTLLGGLVVKLGSRMIDSSLRTKLAGLKVAMKGGI
jgi:F-type H+-transporting ATPase subunit delta